VCDEPHFPKGLLDVEEVVDESCLPLGSLFSETQDINHPEASVFSQITQPVESHTVVTLGTSWCANHHII
jgi:hypothetical protein